MCGWQLGLSVRIRISRIMNAVDSPALYRLMKNIKFSPFEGDQINRNTMNHDIRPWLLSCYSSRLPSTINLIGVGVIFTVLLLSVQLHSISCVEGQESGIRPRLKRDFFSGQLGFGEQFRKMAGQFGVGITAKPEPDSITTNSPPSQPNGKRKKSSSRKRKGKRKKSKSPKSKKNSTSRKRKVKSKTSTPPPQYATPPQEKEIEPNTTPPQEKENDPNTTPFQEETTETNTTPPQDSTTDLPISESTTENTVEEVEQIAINPIDEDEMNTTCDNGIILISNTTTTPTFYIQWSPRKSRCRWTIVGDENCEAELSCKVDIPKQVESDDEDEECINEYLQVSDGTAGYMTFCGTTEIVDLRASEGMKDLFVHLKATPEALLKSEDEDRIYGGVNCTVKCAIPGEEEAKQRVPKGRGRRMDNRCVCGLQNEDDRIVGGEDTKFNEYPWQAAVVELGTRMPACGASVINDRFVLSAAHCFGDFVFAEDIEVLIHAYVLDQNRMGKAQDVELGQKGSIRSSGFNLSRRTDADENTQRYKVAEILVHPLYNFRKKYDFDFALLRLDRQININGDTKRGQNDTVVTPICLPPASFTWADQLAAWDAENLPNVTMTVTGWGKAAQNAGGSTRVLQKLDVPYIPFERCNEFLPNRLTTRMLCAGYEGGGRDSCTGDSGGPLTFKLESKQYRQMGVVSYGIGCAKAKKPGV